MPLRMWVALIGLTAMTLLSAPVAAAQAEMVNRPSELRKGTCASPGDVVMVLANLVVTLGDPQGQSGATPVEQSGTVVPYIVDDLLAENHVVTVQKSPEERDTLVACGEVGGTLNPDGTLASGMRGMNGSGLSGIAYFTPNPGFDNTLITILLVPDGSASTGTSSVDTAP